MQRKMILLLLLLPASLFGQVSNTVIYSGVRPLAVENSNSVFRDVTSQQGGKSIGFVIPFDKMDVDSIRLSVRFATNENATYRIELRNADSSKVIPLSIAGVVDTSRQSAWVYFNTATKDTFKLYARASNSSADLFIYYAAFEINYRVVAGAQDLAEVEADVETLYTSRTWRQVGTSVRLLTETDNVVIGDTLTASRIFSTGNMYVGALLGLHGYTTAQLPVSPVDWQVAVNTDSNKIVVAHNGQWSVISGTGGSGLAEGDVVAIVADTSADLRTLINSNQAAILAGAIPIVPSAMSSQPFIAEVKGDSIRRLIVNSPLYFNNAGLGKLNQMSITNDGFGDKLQGDQQSPSERSAYGVFNGAKSWNPAGFIEQTNLWSAKNTYSDTMIVQNSGFGGGSLPHINIYAETPLGNTNWLYGRNATLGNGTGNNYFAPMWKHGSVYGFNNIPIMKDSNNWVNISPDQIDGIYEQDIAPMNGKFAMVGTGADPDMDKRVSQSGAQVYAADAGANDTYVITLSPAPSAYVNGMIVSFKANTVNTGAATINVNSLGVKTIKKLHDQDLANGDIEANQFVTLIYDGTNFEMQSQIANSASGSGTDTALAVGYGLVRSTVTNTITARVDTSGNNPPVTVANLISKKLSAFAATTSAELAVVLSDETGSGGGFVRGTSPSITTPDIVTPTITSSSGANNTWSGYAISSGTAAVTITQWQVLYMDGSSTWRLADANGSGTYPARGISAVPLDPSDAVTALVVRGIVRNDSWAWTPGGTIYLSTTAGGLTQTAPSTSGDKVQQVGFALDADRVCFDFNSTFVEVP